MKWFYLSILLTFEACIGISPDEKPTQKNEAPSVNANRPKGRIIGGKSAFNGQFPFHVMIRLFTHQGDYVFCGGTLIAYDWSSKNYVLTAAHCLERMEAAVLTIGSSKSPKIFGRGVETLLVSSDYFITHPDYDGKTMYNDIALIKLWYRLPSTFTIKPVRFQYAYMTSDSYFDNKMALISGWGKTTNLDEAGGPLHDLQFAEVKVMPIEICEQKFKAFDVMVNDSFICTFSDDSKTCDSDDGGPLVHKETMTLIGIAIGSKFCELNTPNVFTSVNNYYAWMQSVLKSDHY